MFRTTMPLLLVLSLAACDAGEREAATDADTAADPAARPPAGTSGARATLRDSANAEVGTAEFRESGGGTQLDVRVSGLAPGEHGIHVHMVGRCDAAIGFESAGEHLNPTNAQHGLDNPAGPHMGDLPNLVVSADSTGNLTHTSAQLRLGDALDGDGAAIVVHAAPDDQTTDPSGNSGARVLCGEIERA